MKIAVTSQGKDLDSQLDPRFGRAAYIIIVDTETLEFEAFDNNENKNAFKGAGIQAAAMVSDKDADILLTGFCGPNAFNTLKAAGVKVVNDQAGRVIDVVQKFKQGNVIFADDSNKDGHW
ncbi:MAG: NifB/NifX family molybdenum-iron cluster-binding protein [Desulfobacula sp.]|jgi:predicted Fe-Mo cluster-binding NifX family protein|nr:NifB/NifX family molybdenum-iron cluster-binding protein [Desulfobacula sp.]